MSQNNQETKKQNNSIIEYTAEDGTNITLSLEIVQKYLVGNDSAVTQQEFALFGALCKARRLNPLTKEAYIIKYGNQPAQIVVSKDAILKRAVLHPQYNGKESGIITKDSDGEYHERQGCFCPEGESLVGGWCKVYRKDRQYPEYMSVSLNEVAQKTKEGKLNTFWMNKTATMLEKVAKVRALREAFVDELAGMYDADEMDSQPMTSGTETIQNTQKQETKIVDPMDDDVVDVEVKKVNLDEI